MDLKQEVALITGSSKGIGRAIAELLAVHGALVYIADIQAELADQTARTITQAGRLARSLALDVADAASIERAVDEVIRQAGKIDILVNNAGIYNEMPIHELDVEDWDRVLNVNLRGTHLCSRAVIKHMLPRRQGKIVNVGSMSAQTGGLKAGADYSASKGGIHTLTKSYARYAAPYNINVNAVAPGFILTDITRSWAERDGAGDEVPLLRIGTPLDVAKAVYFLASPLADYITGQIISVNGGVIMDN